MIKSIYIDNFKALNDFKLDLSLLTVLIGSNGSGKSTILQSIDLICNIVKMDIDSYIQNRGWEPSDLKSQLSSSNKRQIIFKTTFELGNEELIWDITLESNKTENKIYFVKEEVYNKSRNKSVLKYSGRTLVRYNAKKEKNEILPNLNLSSSFMKNIDEDKDKQDYPELCKIKKFLNQSDSFELLSTEKIKTRSSRGKTNSIGLGGEKLASFIHGLKLEQKKDLEKRLKNYVPFINGIETKVKGKPGWLEMNINECFKSGQNPIKIKSIYQSDGILRMIAIASIAEISKNSGVILLDEIEDGINPYLAGKLISDLIDISKDYNRQIILTTHSTVMLDYFDADSINYIWRDKDGQVHGKPLFLNKEMKEKLEYMYPGEIWLNMNENEIINTLQNTEEKHND